MGPRVIFLILLIALLLVGTVGAETLYVFPTANGTAKNSTTNMTFSNKIGGIGDAIDNVNDFYARLVSAPLANNFSDFRKPILAFDTSGVSANGSNTITGITLTLYRVGEAHEHGVPQYGLVGVTPASNTSIAATDYNKVVPTIELAPRLTTAAGLNTWTFNSTGLAYADPKGYTCVTVMSSWGITGVFGGSWGANTYTTQNYFRNMNCATISHRPVMKIDYTIKPTADFSATPTTGAAPLTVTFTDESTNDPTSWLWDFGDGSSENETEQNPVHTFDCGTFTVNLTACNDAGCDYELKPLYIQSGCEYIPTIPAEVPYYPAETIQVGNWAVNALNRVPYPWGIIVLAGLAVVFLVRKR